MSQPKKGRRKPKITVSDIDYNRLMSLANAAQDRTPELADELQTEMERARVVSAASVPADAVQMGSRVRYRADTGEREVTLVFPGEADIAEGRISILTPIGTALIGLSTGQSIPWTARDGRAHELTVLSVEQPAPAAPEVDAV